MGRSYGDAAQLALGRVLDMTGLREFELDAEQGTLTAQGGAVFADILDALAPAGWTLPVVPGTQYVTIGGAIACDIHGKNHGAAGTFGSHVLELGLLTATGDLLVLTPQDNGDLLQATIGGMGLTGVIVWARIRLKRLPSSSLAVDTDVVESLEDALAVLDGPGGVYRVAWLDLLSSRLARGVVTRADHLPADSGDARTTVAPRLTVPAWTPGGLLRPASCVPSTSCVCARPRAGAVTRLSPLAPTCSRSTACRPGRVSTVLRASSSTSWCSPAARRPSCTISW